MHIRESASRAFALATKNPPLFGRVLVAKARAARPLPDTVFRCRFQDVLFDLDSPNRSIAAAMYRGAYSSLVVDAVKRYLPRGGVFIDVGANIGYLSAVAASLVGPRGQVHSFEPVPFYFQNLRRLSELNPSYSIFANPCAVGVSAGTATILITREPGQNTLVAGYKRDAEVESTLKVSVIRLDSYIDSQRIAPVSLIKIDAEGFELPILEGLANFFSGGQRPAIICEIAPRAYPLMSRTVGDLTEFMSQYGYSARDIIDGETPVKLQALRHVTDVLFLANS